MLLKQSQSGFAVLLLLVLIMGLASFGLSDLLSASVKQKNLQNRAKNLKVLLEAKEALLSFTVKYAVTGNLDDMGQLPCPDVSGAINQEGSSDPGCGGQGVNTIGYFPFKTLGKGKIEDSSSECLWYIVSGDYKNGNTPAEMLNWNSVGYLNLVDEDENLNHGNSIDDYPIAFIISPGATISQNRNSVASLPGCHSNYAISSYLEGGPNINYLVDMPITADTVWEILSGSESSRLGNANYNDQVVAIYKDEVWDRIRKMGDLSFDNSALIPAATTVELLTKSLAECIAAIGNADLLRRLPYPAPLLLADYRLNANYDDDPAINYGRFPQVSNSFPITNNLVYDDTLAQSDCEASGVTPYDESFWKNWKDHFYYVVSKDFDAATVAPLGATKCNIASECFTIDGKPNKVSAMVVFAGPAQAGQNRVWWWDDSTSTVTIDNKQNQNSYLEGDNQVPYTGLVQDYNLATSPTDYSYCIEYDNTLFTLSAIKCSDL